MRWFVVLFLLSGLSLFAGEPSEAALKFLEKIRASDKTEKLAEDLAISVFCGPEKRALIDARWKSRAEWLGETEFELSPVLEKLDDDLAAVLLSARTKASPDAALVMAFGLVQKGELWKVAPLEGSFDNTGLGFGSAVRNRVEALEQWMALEKINETSRIRSEERERFRKSMEGVVAAEKLKLEDPEDVLVEFLKAADAGETEQLLVWQGILEREQLPERDWDRDIRATRLGMKNQDSRSAWRTLRSNKVMKVVVEGHGDTEDASYLVAFLSTFQTDPRNECLNPVRFRMFMTDRGWRVKLPPFFAYDHEEVEVHREAFQEDLDWEDRRSAKEMGYVFEIENDVIRSDEAREMLEGVVADLKSGSLNSFLQRIFRELERFDDDDDEGDVLPNQNQGKGNIDTRRMERYEEAVTWWGLALGNDETVEARIQKIYQDGDLSLGVFEIGTDESRWKPRYLEVWMEKGEEGWMILPGYPEPLSDSISPSLLEARQKISESYERDLVKLRREFLADVLKNFKIDDPAGVVVDEAGGLKLVKEWREAAAEGSMQSLIAKSAVRVVPGDPEGFMRDLGYLRSGAASSVAPDQVLGSIVSDRFFGVSLMIDLGPGIEPSFPLAIVVPTQEGHRVLTDIELPLETNKGLRLLNDARIKKLETELPEEDFAAINKLREWHQTTARSVFEKWKIDQSSKTK